MNGILNISRKNIHLSQYTCLVPKKLNVIQHFVPEIIKPQTVRFRNHTPGTGRMNVTYNVYQV